MADIPRVLDVRDFVSSRDVEVSSLLQSLHEFHGAGRHGTAALPRHLRRRATSHKRYGHARRPNLKFKNIRKVAKLFEGHAPAQATNTKPSKGQASEASGTPGAPAHYDDPIAADRPMSRAMRRRPDRYRSQLLQTLSASLAPDSGLGPRRKLETHVWSAQRMKMEERWGHMLPIQAYGRGHGSRSFLHTVKDSGCVMHDASYWTCIQLQGSQRQITAALRHVSSPSELGALMRQSEVFCGAVEFDLNLHAVGAYPASELGPARAMWVPQDQHDRQDPQDKQDQQGKEDRQEDTHQDTPQATGQEGQQNTGEDTQQGMIFEAPAASAASAAQAPAALPAALPAAATAAQRQSEEKKDGDWYPFCHLLLWVHAAAYKDVWGALEAAISAASVAVELSSAHGGLRRVEIAGAACDKVIHRVIQAADVATPSSQHSSSNHPRSSSFSHQLWLGVGRSEAEGAEKLSWNWPEGAMVGLTAIHPGLQQPARAGMKLPGILPRAASKQLPRTELMKELKSWPEAGDWTDGARDLLLTASPSSASYKPSAEGPPPLTGSSVAPPNRAGCPPPLTGCAPPLSTQVLGELRQKEKHEQLLQHGSFRKPAEASTSRMDIDSVPGVGLASGGTPASGTTFPVLLVRRRMSDNVSGWSIIVPHGWVMPVWIGLAMCGVRAAGQTEWHWLSSHCGRPFFPLDHPHTPAGAAMANFQRGQHLKESALRPMGRVRKLPAGPYVPWELSCNPLPQPPTSTAPSRPAASNKATWGRWLTMPTGMPKKVGGMSVGKATAVGDKVGDTVGGTSVGKGAAVGCKGGETDRLGGGDLAGASGNAQQFPPTSSGLTGSGATGSGGNIAPPSPEQHAAQPPLCVVRSHRQAALALDMKIMSPSTEQDQNPQQRRLRGPRGPRTKPPNFCPQRAVDKALAHKLVQWVPCRPPAMRARHVFVFVRLRIQGKGRCEEGAVIATPKDSWTQTVDSTFSQGTASGGPVPLASVSAGTVLSTSVSAGTVPRTSVSAGIVPRTSVSDAMGGSVLLQAKVLCSDAGFTGAGCEISEFNTLGYVTSAVPRGGDNYPAGLGLCNFDLLWALRSKHYVTGQRTDQRDIQVMVLNPGSNALRKAVLTICFEEEVVA